jgi:tRNA(Ile)-lysidine synthase
LIGGGSDRLLLAVSGGPDSVALLLLAGAALGERVAVVTVDHGLRPEAAGEAEFVASLCKQMELPHRTLTVGALPEGNVQAWARRERYRLLGQAADAEGCAWIATAHHADDQIETLLMRLARGSGVDGMAGVRARTGRIIRPLLGFSKAELEEICAVAGIEPVRDPSNEDSDFDRVALRQWLAAANRRFTADAANRTAAAMAEASAALDWMTERLANEGMHHSENTVTLDPTGIPRELQRRLLLKALGTIDGDYTPQGPALDRLLTSLGSGETSTIGNILCRGGAVWRFSPAPPRRSTAPSTS